MRPERRPGLRQGSRRAAGHAVAVAHMADHELGAAAMPSGPPVQRRIQTIANDVGRAECRWERAQLPVEIRDFVLDDERLRNRKCCSLFDC